MRVPSSARRRVRRMEVSICVDALMGSPRAKSGCANPHMHVTRPESIATAFSAVWRVVLLVAASTITCSEMGMKSADMPAGSQRSPSAAATKAAGLAFSRWALAGGGRVRHT